MQAIESFDQAVWNGLQKLRLDTPDLLPVMTALTWLGHPLVAALVAGGLALGLRRSGRGRTAVAALLVVVGSTVLAYGTQVVVKRERQDAFRPAIADQWTRYTFPSEHALAAAAVYGFVALTLLPSLRHRAAVWACGLGLGVLVIAIGFSRMYLTVNFLSDVAAGWLAGGFWALACHLWAQAPARSPAAPR
jgi:membrane-associated phospholipid phosphatase